MAERWRVAEHWLVAERVFSGESVKKVAIPVKILSYSLEALHADASRLAHAIGPNLIEIR